VTASASTAALGASVPAAARPAFVQRLAARLTGSPWFWALFVATAFGMPFARSLSRRLPAAPPVLGTFPAFALLDQGAQPFTSETVRGRILVVEFVSARTLAEAGSPLMRLQQRVRNTADRVHLASFVTTGIAGPGDLARLAGQSHAGAWRWTLASGDAAALETTTLAALGAGGAPASLEGRLLLVDGQGRVRRLLGSTPSEIDLMMRDIGLLANLEGT